MMLMYGRCWPSAVVPTRLAVLVVVLVVVVLAVLTGHGVQAVVTWTMAAAALVDVLCRAVGMPSSPARPAGPAAG